MATLIAVSDGNLTDAATWAVVDSTSLLDTEQVSTASLTTAYVESQSFSPGAITIDGIALKLPDRQSVSPTGTMSVRLAQAGALVAGTEVTIDVSDIPATSIGWMFFKFAAPVTLLAATPYTVSAKTSVINQVYVYRNATAGNWARMLRTTTTAAPVAGDDMFVMGEWTAAATKTDRVVTMNSTAATDYGSGSTTLPGFGISYGGTVTWGTTAATNYILRLSAILRIWFGGTMNMGSVGTECPRTSSMQLEFDCGVDGDFGLQVYGTLTTQGLSRTDGLNVVQCLLNADEAAGQTALSVDTETGWLSGDDIAIASTTRTASQAEQRTLGSNATADTLTVSVALTNAHGGASPTQAEVILLTRNVRIQSVSSTFMAYVFVGQKATVDCDWTSFRYLGTVTSGKRGVEITTTADGSVSLSYCAIRDFDRWGIHVGPTSDDWDNLTIEHLTGYKVGHQTTSDAAILLDETSGSSWSLSFITIISNNAFQGYGLDVSNGKGNISNLRLSCGGGYGMNVGLPSGEAIDGTWSDIELHSNGVAGFRLTDGIGLIATINAWRNGSSGGYYLDGSFGRFIVQGGLVFGNTTQNVNVSNFNGTKRFIFRNLTVAGDSTFSTADGFSASANENPLTVTFDNCTFGVASGIFVAHTNADLDFEAQDRYAECYLINTVLGSSTEIANATRLLGRSFIAYQRQDQTAGSNQTYYPAMGTVAIDTILYRTATPSEKLSPVGATPGQRLESGPKRANVASGNTFSVSVYVQKDASYSGSAPRLMVRANPAVGISIDTVIATFTAASGTWQQLSGTTNAATDDGVLEFYVDCDGNAGQVNVDDWSGS